MWLFRNHIHLFMIRFRVELKVGKKCISSNCMFELYYFLFIPYMWVHFLGCTKIHERVASSRLQGYRLQVLYIMMWFVPLYSQVQLSPLLLSSVLTWCLISSSLKLLSRVSALQWHDFLTPQLPEHFLFFTCSKFLLSFFSKEGGWCDEFSFRNVQKCHNIRRTCKQRWQWLYTRP